MNTQSVSERLISQAKDLREYQQLKEANEMEREATRKLYERYRREGHTDASARETLKQRGYDTGLLK